LNRFSVLVCQVVLLASPFILLAQHGGRGAGAGPTTPAAPNPAPNSDISDFNRAVALQATPDQIAQFQRSTKSTETARKDAQTLIQLSQNASNSDSSRYTDLNDAIDEARTNNLQFMRSLSASQQSGLKPQTKRLAKADADISKQSKALAHESEQRPIDTKKIAGLVEKLDNALSAFQSDQIDMGKEMGIQSEEHSQ
jgi:predicted  nucleic acid-binding Zn-ribbon protein